MKLRNTVRQDRKINYVIFYLSVILKIQKEITSYYCLNLYIKSELKLLFENFNVSDCEEIPFDFASCWFFNVFFFFRINRKLIQRFIKWINGRSVWYYWKRLELQFFFFRERKRRVAHCWHWILYEHYWMRIFFIHLRVVWIFGILKSHDFDDIIFILNFFFY